MYEVHDYIKSYLGETEEAHDFAKAFLDRRQKVKTAEQPPASQVKCGRWPEDVSSFQKVYIHVYRLQWSWSLKMCPY